MAEDIARQKQYQYTAMSSLVLQQDRTVRRNDEPTGEPETLRGRIDFSTMGDRATHELSIKEREEAQGHGTTNGKRAEAVRDGKTSVLEFAGQLQELRYRPKTRESREQYSILLSLVHRLLGDEPEDVTYSAADDILALLKDDNLRDADRKRAIEEIISASLREESYHEVLNIGKKINDYTTSTMDEGNHAPVETAMDSETALSVVFAGEEEDDQTLGGALRYEAQELENEEAADEERERRRLLGIKDENDDEQSGYRSTDQMMDGDVTAKASTDIVRLQHQDIDAHWLQRTLSPFYDDVLVSQSMARSVLTILESASDIRDCENRLVALLEYDKFDLVKLFLNNRWTIAFGMRLSSAENDTARIAVQQEMASSTSFHTEQQSFLSTPSKREGKTETVIHDAVSGLKPKVLDLSALAFEQGGHFMSNRKVELPDGSTRKTRKGYEEIHVPFKSPPALNAGEHLVEISSLPLWMQPVFDGMTYLNVIQSRLYKTVLFTDESILLCAPTGSGKTNVAMLSILHEMQKHMESNGGTFNVDAFKIVYIAPMKALVQEMVGNFSQRLERFGIKVSELSGDRQLTKQQLAETQIIVTTPEKWDIVTRKSTEKSYTSLVKLVIIDEIHLLHDDRGPVLEALITRMIRQNNIYRSSGTECIRLVGLSATLPNYVDVATFMHVRPQGLYYFDNSFRPCPLSQTYIGITEKKALKRQQLLNEVTYEKMISHAGKYQLLIFVHSRKDTAKTAIILRDLCIKNDTLGQLLQNTPESRFILQEEAEKNIQNPSLKEVLPFGFAIHHAGLSRLDRKTVEDLFADGHVQVLISTSTLAWGVNLPAHTVIIKGTQVYSPEKGRWVEISPQDIMQMLGRAGRPQYDEFGEGIILTSSTELQYYLSLLNQQLPIESQMIQQLADHLNAEFVQGHLRSRQDASEWIKDTYLFTRMLRAPSIYGLSIDEFDKDPSLIQRRLDLAHSCCLLLDKAQLIQYDRRTGDLTSLELGRIASHYYVSHTTMATYLNHLHPHLTEIELCRTFSLSDEFRYIPVRQDERLELQKMMERVPIPIKESIDDANSGSQAKINVLLQAYISQLSLDGFALMADMVYITQSAGRLFRALFEICLSKGWAHLAKRALTLSLMVQKRQWLSMSPLRQIPVEQRHGISELMIRQLEKKELSFGRLCDLKPEALGELLRAPNKGNSLYRLLHELPRFEVQVFVQPITRSMLCIEASIKPDFQFNEQLSGPAEPFWVLVTDGDDEIVLHVDYFVLKKKYANEDHLLTFNVALFDPLPSNYFLHIISDRWLHCTTTLPIVLIDLLLPDKYPPPTELLDLQPLTIDSVLNKSPLLLEDYKAHQISQLNAIQTQVYQSIVNSTDNVYIAAPTGSGKTLCLELAFMKLIQSNTQSKIVYVGPFEQVVNEHYLKWKRVFPECSICQLTGENDLKLVESNQLICTTPQLWDKLSRRWRQRKVLQRIDLYLIDELHLLSEEPTLEIIVSRARYISAQCDHPTRIVALSVCTATAKDIGEWIGCPSQNIYAFPPNTRPMPLDIQVIGSSIPHVPSMLMSLVKPVFLQCQKHTSNLVYVPSHQRARTTALEMMALQISSLTDEEGKMEVDGMKEENGNDKSMKGGIEDGIIEGIQDKALKVVLKCGIGFYHGGLNEKERNIVRDLFMEGLIRILVVAEESCWQLSVFAESVILMGTQGFIGSEHRYVDYRLPNILHMVGRSLGKHNKLKDERQQMRGYATVYTQMGQVPFYRKFLSESLPVESHLDHCLHDHFNAEIVTKTIENKQDAVDYLTWTLMYRRMTKNPNYYGLAGTTQRHLSDHLSELIENTLSQLEKSKCITIENDFDLSPLNLGMIAAYYHIHYGTVELFSMSIRPKTKLRGLLEILTAATEFDKLPSRHQEDRMMERLYERVPVKFAEIPNFSDPHVKAFILLQCHFSRMQLPADLEADQKLVLKCIVPLIQACVDVISSHGWLAPALAVMELSQMTVQAMWDRDGDLRQLPYFTNEVISRCSTANITSILQLMELEDSDRRSLLCDINDRQLAQVAAACNRYPAMDIEFAWKGETIVCNEPAILQVQMAREDQEVESIGPVLAPFYPGQKEEGWWLVVGDTQTNALLAIKRVNVPRQLTVKLEIVPPQDGFCNYTLFAICDAYLGCDQEYEFNAQVLPSEGEVEAMVN